MIKVCVIGKWKGETSENLDISYLIGQVIARNQMILITGGGPGVMEAASRGAKATRGLTVGFLASENRKQAAMEKNNYLDVEIYTGMGWDVRSNLAVRSSDAVVMIGGGNGTLGELTSAYMYSKPIFAIKGSGGWADGIVDSLCDGKYIDDRRNTPIQYISFEELEDKLIALKGVIEEHGS